MIDLNLGISCHGSFLADLIKGDIGVATWTSECSADGCGRFDAVHKIDWIEW